MLFFMVQSGKKSTLNHKSKLLHVTIDDSGHMIGTWSSPPWHLLTLPSICTCLRGDITMKTWSTTPTTTLHLPWRRRINDSKSYLAWHALHIMHSTYGSFHVDTLQNIWDEYLVQSNGFNRVIFSGTMWIKGSYMDHDLPLSLSLPNAMKHKTAFS